ncbi:hypothetical protein [Amycolatopsis magusensis]|uniref:hypothetical protein n=1 Tax=Amycolatopsis magusensis TaxID=882444 RepID=UPI00379B0427
MRTTAKRHAQEYVIRDLDGVRRAVRSGWLTPAEGRDPRPQVEAQLVREQLLKVIRSAVAPPGTT